MQLYPFLKTADWFNGIPHRRSPPDSDNSNTKFVNLPLTLPPTIREFLWIFKRVVPQHPDSQPKIESDLFQRHLWLCFGVME